MEQQQQKQQATFRKKTFLQGFQMTVARVTLGSVLGMVGGGIKGSFEARDKVMEEAILIADD